MKPQGKSRQYWKKDGNVDDHSGDIPWQRMQAIKLIRCVHVVLLQHVKVRTFNRNRHIIARNASRNIVQALG